MERLTLYLTKAWDIFLRADAVQEIQHVRAVQ